MLSTGFRLVTGSWKIIAMSRPRMARTSASGIVSRSRPWNSMLPLTVALGTMPVRPMMALAVTLLPQPLSPTRPTSSPGATSKLTRFTAWTVPSWDAKSTVRSVSRSSVSPHSTHARSSLSHARLCDEGCIPACAHGRADASRERRVRPL